MDFHRYLSGWDKALSHKLKTGEKQIVCKLIIINALQTWQKRVISRFGAESDISGGGDGH